MTYRVVLSSPAIDDLDDISIWVTEHAGSLLPKAILRASRPGSLR